MFQKCSLSGSRLLCARPSRPGPFPNPSEGHRFCHSGARFCTHHDPAKFTGVQCAATKKNGQRCQVFSGSAYSDAQPLRNGEKYCRHHLGIIRCAATKQNGFRCWVTSNQTHAHAQPLRQGKKYCLHHQHLDASAKSAAAKPTTEPAAAEPAAAEPAAAEPAAAEPVAAEPTVVLPTVGLAAAEPAATKPMVATEPTEPTITPTTALDGREYDYSSEEYDQNYDDIYDDIGGIYDSCDDYNYNYDSDPADDR